MTPLLLDTCAMIWLAAGRPVAAPAAEALTEAHRESAPVLVSPISAWEVGMLVSRGRLALSIPPRRWIKRLLSLGGLRLADLSVDVLLDSSFLPGQPPRDPADRIVIATARDTAARILTRDRAILAYAAAGHASALPC